MGGRPSERVWPAAEERGFPTPEPSEACPPLTVLHLGRRGKVGMDELGLHAAVLELLDGLVELAPVQELPGRANERREGGRRRPTVSVQGARARREGREGGAKTPKTREEDEKRGERQWGAGSRRLLTWQRSSSAPKDSTGRGSGGRIEVCPPSSPPTTLCRTAVPHQLCIAAPHSVAKILWIPARESQSTRAEG